MLVPSPQLVLQREGWVVQRGWWWLCTRVLLAEHASGLRDLNLAHGRRAPPEQPGRMGASGTTWAGRILHLLARSDAHSFAPCGRLREAVVGQPLRLLRWAVRRWRGRRASRRFPLFFVGLATRASGRAGASDEQLRGRARTHRVGRRYVGAKPDTEPLIRQEQVTNGATYMRSRLDLALIPLDSVRRWSHQARYVGDSIACRVLRSDIETEPRSDKHD